MTATQRNARGEASRQKILAVTVQLVSRYGYDSTRISRIVNETGLPASSIYWQFKNKDELITTALENSYSSKATGSPSWTSFDPAIRVIQQLAAELTPELHASETEDPIRVGIMLALEGAASDSQVQTPFRSRRLRVQHRLERWWAQALSVPHSDVGNLQEKADRLAKLTLAFLDGHYISDVAADKNDVAHRGSLLSHVLWSAYEHSLEECDRFTHAIDREEWPTTAASLGNKRRDSREDALLSATRHLVAEHGYEGATVSRICERSGMKRSSLYWRYKDKDALVKAAVSDPFVEMLQPLGELPSDTRDWATTLSFALVEFVDRIARNPDAVKAGLLLKLQRWDSPTSTGSVVLSGAKAVEEALAAWFNRVLPPSDQELVGAHLAWLTARLCDGIMLDLVLWKQGVAFSTRECLHAILALAVRQWFVSLSSGQQHGALSLES